MKKEHCLFTLILMSQLAESAYSQIKIGATGGATWANFTSETEENITSKMNSGFGMGVVINTKLSNRFSLQFEPMFLQKGNIDILRFGTITTESQYLEFPAILKASFHLSAVKPFLIAGPTIGYFLSSETNFNPDKDAPEILRFDIDSRTRRINFGIVLGLGFEFPVDKLDIFVRGSYTSGLTNLFKIRNSTRKAKNISAFAGVLVPLNLWR